MKEWEAALNKFLESYIYEDYFLGAILTGSYATGNNDINSDIDVFIVTKDSTAWRERGNKLVDGYLIEYFINPIRKVIKEFDEGFDDYHIATTLIFAGSKILYDKDGTIEKLVNRAKKDLATKELNPILESKWKMNCYNVWHSFYELNSKYTKKKDIDFTYSLFLNDVVNAHLLNNKIPLFPVHKIERIFTDEEFRKRYNVKKLQEKEFVDKVLMCFNEKDYDKKFICAENLYNYYMEHNPKFNINNFSLVSEAK